MRLIHFSATPVTEVYAVQQEVKHPRDFGPKPKGLWVSDEDEYGWREWCEDNQFGEDRMTCAHLVELADDARAMTLTSAEDIDRFTDQYGHERDGGHYYWADWERLATTHQGILITPYIWQRRMTNHTSWYYPWDCASGCIWDPAAVKSITPIDLPPTAAELERIREGLVKL